MRSERNEILAKLKYIRGILAIQQEQGTPWLKPIDGIGSYIEELRKRINSLED